MAVGLILVDLNSYIADWVYFVALFDFDAVVHAVADLIAVVWLEVRLRGY